MKPKFAIRKISLFLVLPIVLVSLAGGNTFTFAQDTNTPSAAVDVSQYPTNASLLPGKGPDHVWSGLPRVWAQRHAQWAKTAENDHGAVVFLGDSITQGWNSLAQDFSGLKVANRGIGGDTTRGVLYRLDADVLTLKPKAVVLLIGTNDLGNGAKPEDVMSNIEMILSELKDYDANMPIVVCRVMPRSDQNNRFAGKVETLNKMIDSYVKSHPNLVECDTWSIFANADGGCQPEDFHPDLLHPNAKGYEKWEAALKPIFAKLDLQTTAQ